MFRKYSYLYIILLPSAFILFFVLVFDEPFLTTLLYVSYILAGAFISRVFLMVFSPSANFFRFRIYWKHGFQLVIFTGLMALMQCMDDRQLNVYRFFGISLLIGIPLLWYLSWQGGNELLKKVVSHFPDWPKNNIALATEGTLRFGEEESSGVFALKDQYLHFIPNKNGEVQSFDLRKKPISLKLRWGFPVAVNLSGELEMIVSYPKFWKKKLEQV